MGGQHPGKQPRPAQMRKGGQLLHAGGQQDAALGPFQQAGRRGGVGGGQGVPGQGAGRPQQPQIPHPRQGAGRPDVLAGLPGVGVGGVHAERRPSQQGGHLPGLHPAGVDGKAGGRPLLRRAVFGGDADGDGHAFGGQLMGQPPALGGAAENDDHFLYPRGVMSLPRSIRVEDAPTKTVVNISTSASCS